MSGINEDIVRAKKHARCSQTSHLTTQPSHHRGHHHQCDLLEKTSMAHAFVPVFIDYHKYADHIYELYAYIH